MEFTPIFGGYDDSWLIKRLDKHSNESKFALIGSIWWMRALSILVNESQIDINKFYENVSTINFDENNLNNIFASALMSLDYLNTVQRIEKLDDIDNLSRISIIAWYYGIYNAAQTMILATDKSCPQTHAHTADEWYEKFVSRNFIPAPFNYNLNTLIEKEYLKIIANYEDFDMHENKKPRDDITARAMCCSYLKSTAKWYFETKYKEQIKNTREFRGLNKSDFRSKSAKTIRDNFLAKKKISFLHQTYRYRGKSNYRDAPYIAYANALFVNTKEFITDLRVVLEEFIYISFVYVKRRIGKSMFVQFADDVIENSNFSEYTKEFLKNNFY